MTFEFWHYALTIAAGIIAGVVNTLAGSGSLFTLPLLLFLGLPPHLANGTNRVGILAQTFAGALTLYRNGHYKPGKDSYLIIPPMLGSALGAYVATTTPESILKITIGFVMSFLLIIILFNYSSLLREKDIPVSAAKKFWSYPLLFVIGVYGGFIQLGVGIFALTALLLVLNLTFLHANALKNMINFFLTVPAFLIFAYHGQINWKLGCIIAIGQTFGAWIAAKYASENKKAKVWISRLLVLMTAVTALKLFDVI